MNTYTPRLTTEIDTFFRFYSPNSKLKAEIDVFFWQIKPKKLMKWGKYANFSHKLKELASNFKMNITKVISSTVCLNVIVNLRLVHRVNEWISSFQNCELLQFVQLKYSFYWTSSWTTDPLLTCTQVSWTSSWFKLIQQFNHSF